MGILAEAQRQSSALLLLLLLVSLQFLSPFAQVLPSGLSPSFSTGEPAKFWVSEAGGSYTFGFKALNQSRFLLAIWQSQDANQTPIWWAAQSQGPVFATQDSLFLYSESSGLLQMQLSPSETLWRSASSGSVRFVDSGNLQLLDGNASVWESFQDHRNTLMLISLTPSNLLNKPRLLQSTESQTSYANGQFHMATDSSLHIALFGIDQLQNQYVYMNAGSMKIKISSPGGAITFGTSKKAGAAYNSEDPQLEKLTLDSDGNLRVYRWFESNATWVAVWAVLQDGSLHCRAANPCGPFGLCEVGTNNCSCPPGYSPISSTNMSRGCNTTRSAPGCGESGSKLGIIAQRPYALFFYNDLGLHTVSGIEDCETLCLNDCNCMAAIYAGSQCFLKGNMTLEYMVNGISNMDNFTLLMKLRAEATPRRAERSWPIYSIVLMALAGVVIVVVCVMLGISALRRQRGFSFVAWFQRGADRNIWDIEMRLRPVRFKYQEVVNMTGNFRDKLGRGGCATVYKGSLTDRQTSRSEAVAVKVLNSSITNNKQFQAELDALSKVSHKNLVSVIGFCTDGPREATTMLVLEYMENGSLDRYLFPEKDPLPLSWSDRRSIAEGTACAIAYLHHQCSPPILHLDIKPHNVLLGRKFTPKVADFAFAEIFFDSAQNYKSMSTGRGTPAFMAPEMCNSMSDSNHERRRRISPKTDVYSFGMLLLLLVYGLNTFGHDLTPLIWWAVKALEDGSVVRSDIDESTIPESASTDRQSLLPASTTDQNQEAPTEQPQLRLLRVALWCVQTSPADRPSMSEVFRWIEGNEHINNPPARF